MASQDKCFSGVTNTRIINSNSKSNATPHGRLKNRERAPDLIETLTTALTDMGTRTASHREKEPAQVRPRKQADCIVSQVCCSRGALRWHHTAQGCARHEANHRKEGPSRQSSLRPGLRTGMAGARRPPVWRLMDTATAPFLCPPHAIVAGSCAGNESLWGLQGGTLSSAMYYPAAVNVDCNECTPGRVAKLYSLGGSSIAYNATSQQLEFTAGGCTTMCLTAGASGAQPPCGGGAEPWLPA